MPLSAEELESATLTIRSTGDSSGEIRIPSVQEWQQRFTWRNSSYWRDSDRTYGDPNLRGTIAGTRQRDPNYVPPAYEGSQDGDLPLLSEERYIAEMMENYLQEQEWVEFRSSGVYRFQIDTPPRGGSIDLTATIQLPGAGTTTTTLRLEPYHSRARKFISIQTSNKRTDIGEYAVFHVRSNFPMTYFYLIVSNSSPGRCSVVRETLPLS